MEDEANTEFGDWVTECKSYVRAMFEGVSTDLASVIDEATYKTMLAQQQPIQKTNVSLQYILILETNLY